MSIQTKTEILSKAHQKDTFSCGETSLDVYLKNYASQDLKRRVSGVFVLTNDNHDIQGYYTLSSSSIIAEELPEKFIKKFPTYTHLPVTLIGRLAVDKKYQGKGLGETLLLDALLRSYNVSKEIGSIAVIVDALHEQAARFYQSYGFISLPSQRKLFIPMKTIGQIFK